MRPAKTQIRPVWSESSLSAWRNLGSLATHRAHSEDSDQTGRMPRLIWVFAGRTLALLVLSRGGSYRSIDFVKLKKLYMFKLCRQNSKHCRSWSELLEQSNFDLHSLPGLSFPLHKAIILFTLSILFQIFSFKQIAEHAELSDAFMIGAGAGPAHVIGVNSEVNCHI